MAKFSQAFLQGLLQPTYQQGLFDVAKSVGQAPAVMGLQRRRDEELSQIDQLVTASTQANAAAQQGDVSAVIRQINQLRQQMATATTVDQKKMFAEEIMSLQSLIPNAQVIKQTKSVDTLLRIDNELEDTTELRERINQSYAQKGLEPISQQNFDRMVSALKTQQTSLKQDPDVNTEYADRKLDDALRQLEIKKVESAEWIGNNKAKLSAAIKSGNQKNLDAVLSTVPSLYVEQVQDFVSSELRFQKEIQDFRDNSIIRNQEPLNKDFTSSIENLPEGLQDEELRVLNQKYVEYLEENWDDKNKTWKGVSRNRAAVLEEQLIKLIANRNERATLNAWEATEDQKLADERVIKEANIRIDAFIPDSKDEKDLAEQFAAEDKKDYSKLEPEVQQDYRVLARNRLIEENKRIQQAIIAGVDITQAPAQSITEEENSRFSVYTPDEQEIIMEEYGEVQKGQMSLTQLMDELEEDGFITAPTEDKTKEPVLYRREPGFRFMDRLQERYDQNVEGMANRRSGKN